MNILIAGGSGLIGQSVARRLVAAGHEVWVAGRSAASERHIHADFSVDGEAQVWISRLRRIDVVINAVGILRETSRQSFAMLHTRTPIALFDACALAGVSRVIQISALGAQTGRTEYFASKHRADEHLASLPLSWVIVQPSIVYGAGGSSARLFTTLASLPVIPLPGGGTQQLQPIHIDDLSACIVALCIDHSIARRRVALVGPRAVSLRAMLQELRGALGLRRAPVLPIPAALMRSTAAIAEWLPHSLLDRASLTMLEMGNTADPAATSALLGRAPRDVAQFVSAAERSQARVDALLGWLLPMLRGSIALVWIWTAIVSFGLYPRSQSLQLLAQAGVPAALRSMALYGAAFLDLCFGFATLFMRRRRMLWLAQIALILGYSLVITLRLPEYWLHPYGPMIKNLPMLAAIYLLYTLESRRWNT